MSKNILYCEYRTLRICVDILHLKIPVLIVLEKDTQTNEDYVQVIKKHK